jgi:hypothetical protein
MQEACLVRRHSPHLPYPAADDHTGTDRSGPWPRTRWCGILQQTLYRLVKDAAKLSAPVLAVGKHVEPHLAL